MLSQFSILAAILINILKIYLYIGFSPSYALEHIGRSFAYTFLQWDECVKFWGQSSRSWWGQICWNLYFWPCWHNFLNITGHVVGGWENWFEKPRYFRFLKRPKILTSLIIIFYIVVIYCTICDTNQVFEFFSIWIFLFKMVHSGILHKFLANGGPPPNVTGPGVANLSTGLDQSHGPLK